MGAASLIGRLLTGWLLDRFVASRVSFMMLSLAARGHTAARRRAVCRRGVRRGDAHRLGMGGQADVTPDMLARYFGLLLPRGLEPSRYEARSKPDRDNRLCGTPNPEP